MPPNLARLRAHRDAIYQSGKLPTAAGATIDAWPTGITRPAGEYLRDLLTTEFGRAPRTTPLRTVEVGLALGLSTLFILDAVLSLEDSGALPPGSTHTAIDPYQHNYWGSAGTLALEAAGVAGRVTLIEQDSLLALPRLVEDVERGGTPRFDFAFIDGGHFYENAFIDTFYAHRLVRPGGLILVDDIWMPGIRLAVAYFETNLGSTRLPVDPRASKRFALLRTPAQPAERAWDHFTDFTPAASAPAPTA